MSDAEVRLDWSIFDHPRVEEICRYVATRISGHVAFRKHLDFEDEYQEALVEAAGMGKLVHACILGDGGMSLGTFQHALYMDRLNAAETTVRRASKHVSAEERYDEGGDEYVPPFRAEPPRGYSPTYDRAMVEQLMPAIWDADYAYGMLVENAPDIDMPRGSTNKATGNTLAAHLADIRIGWEHAPLSIDERRALLLYYGLDWEQRDIAVNQVVSQSTISNRLISGVGKIVAELNGGDFTAFFSEEVALA